MTQRQHSQLFQLWTLQTQRMNFLTRIGCKVEFTWSAEHRALCCTITPPIEITGSKFGCCANTVDGALFGAYKIAMEAGVFDPMEETEA